MAEHNDIVQFNYIYEGNKWSAMNGEKVMNCGTRVCIAFIVGRIISAKMASHVYDYSESRHISIGGSVIDNDVNIYDYDRGCYFSGKMPSLYDYGTGAHVQLKINGNQFSGYDYNDGHHFSGSVSGNSITIYDHGESKHFSYSI